MSFLIHFVVAFAVSLSFGLMLFYVARRGPRLLLGALLLAFGFGVMLSFFMRHV